MPERVRQVDQRGVVSCRAGPARRRGIVRRLVYEYIEHYHRERNHQGLDNQLACNDHHLREGRTPTFGGGYGLGGLLSFYNREAA